MERNDLIERLDDAASRWLENGEDESGELARDAADALLEAATTIASLSEALAEAEKKGAEDWQPIETAPKDETLILISAFVTRAAFDHDAMAHTRRKDEQPTVCQAYFSGDLWQTGDFTFAHQNDATHWRPLPAPPRDLSQGGQHG